MTDLADGNLGGHIDGWLDAFIDGELEPAAHARWERHIAGCAACRHAVDERARLSAAVRAHADRFPAPPELGERLGAALAALGDAPAVVPLPSARQDRWRQRLTWGLALAASFVLAAVLSATVTIGVLRGGADDRTIDSLIDGHVRSLITGDLVAVASSDQHTVKPWFAGRLPLAPPVRDFAAEGFPLVGGRLDYLNGTEVAALVYRRNKHIINLFVGRAPDGLATQPTAVERQGYTVIRWRDQDLGFAAVTDAEAGELAAFVKLVRSP